MHANHNFKILLLPQFSNSGKTAPTNPTNPTTPTTPTTTTLYCQLHVTLHPLYSYLSLIFTKFYY